MSISTFLPGILLSHTIIAFRYNATENSDAGALDLGARNDNSVSSLWFKHRTASGCKRKYSPDANARLARRFNSMLAAIIITIISLILLAAGWLSRRQPIARNDSSQLFGLSPRTDHDSLFGPTAIPPLEQLTAELEVGITQVHTLLEPSMSYVTRENWRGLSQVDRQPRVFARRRYIYVIEDLRDAEECLAFDGTNGSIELQLIGDIPTVRIIGINKSRMAAEKARDLQALIPAV